MSNVKCHISHVTCQVSCVFFLLQIDVAIWPREGGPLEVLVMGSDVRCEERPCVGKNKHCDAKHFKQVGMFSLESLSSHANWETEEIQYII